MPVTDQDRADAKAFCDQIGCTTVHHLRDELPAFVASIREAERARCLPAHVADVLQAAMEYGAMAKREPSTDICTGSLGEMRSRQLREIHDGRERQLSALGRAAVALHNQRPR